MTYKQRIRADRTARGVCVLCGKFPPVIGKQCAACTEARKLWRKPTGLCRKCKAAPAQTTRGTCAGCKGAALDKRRERIKQRRWELHKANAPLREQARLARQAQRDLLRAERAKAKADGQVRHIVRPPKPSPLRDAARKIVISLRTEAEGRTCGTCKCAMLVRGSGFCTIHVGIPSGMPVRILRPDAVACRDHKKDMSLEESLCFLESMDQSGEGTPI